MKNLFNWVLEYHLAKLVATVVGLFFSSIYLFAGFFDALVVFLIFYIAIFFAQKIEKREEKIEKLLNLFTRLFSKRSKMR